MSALVDLPTALAWLRDVATELGDVPTRLHERGTTDGALGGPRFAGAFVNHVDGKPYEVRQAPREVACPAEHPIQSLGEPRCPMCDDTRTWTTSTDVYAHPLRAALATLGRARSRLRPHPRVIVDALLRERCDPAAAALRLPGELAPDDHRFLSALRALYDGFSYTAIAPASRQAA